MDGIKKIFELWKDGINSPEEITFFIISLILTVYPLLNKLFTIKSFNDFDRLLFPKNERSIQQKIAIIFDYLLFSFLYFLPGYILAIAISHINKLGFGIILVNMLQWIFTLTLIPIILKVFFVQILGERIARKIQLLNKFYQNKFIKFSFNINVYISFVVFASFLEIFLFKLKGEAQSGVFFLLFFPMLLLYLYRIYNKRIDYKYICNIISEIEFNESMLVVDYTLDKDRMIFSKATDPESKEIFIYDRTSGKYLKFTRISVVSSS